MRTYLTALVALIACTPVLAAGGFAEPPAFRVPPITTGVTEAVTAEAEPFAPSRASTGRLDIRLLDHPDGSVEAWVGEALVASLPAIVERPAASSTARLALGDPMIASLAVTVPTKAVRSTKKRWDPVAPGAESSRPGDQHISNYAIDTAASGGDPRPVLDAYGPTLRRLCSTVKGMTASTPGSWNFGPNACSGLAGMGDREALEILARYAEVQLTSPRDGGHGLGGREMLSRRYDDTRLSGLEVAAAKASGPAQAALHRVLRGSVYLYALWAHPDTDGDPGTGDGRVVLVAPGTRSKSSTSGAPLISTWWASKVFGAERPASGWNRQWATPLRVAWAYPSDPWLSAADRRLLADHLVTGGRAEEIVAVLQELGVTLQAPAHALRTVVGAAGWMEANVNGNSAPTMASSVISGRVHGLHLHPHPEDSGGDKRLGICTAQLEGARIVGSCKAAINFRGPPPKGVSFDPATSTYTGTIPAPSGAVLYHVIVGPGGAELVGAVAPSKPAPSPPITLTDLEMVRRIVAAWITPQVRLEDVPPPRDPDRVQRLVDLLRAGNQ